LIRHQTIVPLFGMATVLILVLWFVPHGELSTGAISLISQDQVFEAGPLPDLSGERNIRQRKEKFFKYLMPVIQFENHRLADIRQRLVYIQECIRFGHKLAAEDQSWFDETLVDFRLADQDVSGKQFWPLVFMRVDQFPVDLVLVQAANESAWGTSRFAREGNNLFGQWCFSPGCGMVPEGRPEGETYEVARFDSIPHAVAAYMRNLNTGHAYDRLREIRAEKRHQGEVASAAELAGGLIYYSQRREDYVSELLAMLKVNAPIIDEIRSSGPDKPEA